MQAFDRKAVAPGARYRCPVARRGEDEDGRGAVGPLYEAWNGHRERDTLPVSKRNPQVGAKFTGKPVVPFEMGAGHPAQGKSLPGYEHPSLARGHLTGVHETRRALEIDRSTGSGALEEQMGEPSSGQQRGSAQAESEGGRTAMR